VQIEVRVGAEIMMTSVVLSTLVSHVLHFYVSPAYTNVPAAAAVCPG